MKPIIYIFLFCLCFSLHLSAQNYKSMVMEDWVNSNWAHATRTANTFDSNGNITMVTMDSLNYATSVWDKSMLTTNTLNPNSTINYSIIQSWNKVGNNWEDALKMIYTYDGSKNVLTQKMQMFFGADWMDFSMSTYSYSNGFLSKNVEQQLNFMTNMMENSSQSNYSYNADGTENQNLSQNWNIMMGAWVNNMRTTNTYDASKRISSILTEDFTTGAWVNSTKSTMTYNPNGSISESLGQDWNVSTSSWVDNQKENYSYNADGSTNQILTTEWKSNLNKWDNQSRITYTYNSTSFSQLELADSGQLRVFPNPFTNIVTIDYKSLKAFSIQIYNSNGQLVKNIEKGEPLSIINLASLKNGIYLLKVVSPESQKVVKLLKYK